MDGSAPLPEIDDDDTDAFDVYDEAFEAEQDAKGVADHKAGGVVSHTAVERWLLSWGAGKPPLPTQNRRLTGRSL